MCLPWRDWTVHRSLGIPAAADAFGVPEDEVRPLPVPDSSGRGHARMRYRAGRIVMSGSGVGLGYLGGAAPAISFMAAASQRVAQLWPS